MAPRSELVERLGQVPLFSGFGRKEREAVIRSSSEVTHPAGKEVVSEGRDGVGFHLILSGSAVVTQGGRTLGVLGPGEYFGEIALIDGGPRAATVRAETELRTLSITAWDFKPLLHEHPLMAEKLLVELCRRVRVAEGRTAS